MPHTNKILSLENAIEIALLANEERYRLKIELANLKGTQIEGPDTARTFDNLKQVKDYLLEVERDVKLMRDEIQFMNAQDAITLSNEILTLAESVGVEAKKLK